ncbi:MAG: response regulator [Ignavibacteria bacterium]|nr:response regulator [Ignavibacteria bacterium]
MLLLAILMSLTGFILLPENAMRWTALAICFIFISTICLRLTCKGHVQIASIALISQYWILITILAVTAGGTKAPAFSGFLFIVFTSGLLLKVRDGVITAIICISTEIAIAYAEVNGLLPESKVHNTTYSMLFADFFFITMISGFVMLYSRSMASALHSATHEISVRKQIEIENQKALFELGERVKELTALHSIMKVLQNSHVSLQEILNEIVRLIPPAFQFPNSTQARIQIGNTVATTNAYVQSSSGLTVEFTGTDGKLGSLDVIYTTNCPPSFYGPFLREEIDLITTISELIRVDYDRRQANSDLRRSEAQLQFFANVTLEGIAISEDGVLVECNAQFAALMGYNISEMIGLSVTKFAVPESYETILRHILQQSIEPYIAVGLRKDGTTFNAELWGQPTIYQGRPARVTVIRDITERTKLEEQLRRTQRLETIGALAGGITHDLNNVLTPISLMIDILRSKITDPDLTKMLDILWKGAARGKEIVKRVLTFARGTTDEFSPQQIQHHLYEIDTLIKQTLPKNISMTVSVQDNLPLVLGDATQIHQILMNLCVNARDAMPDGGTLSLSASQHILQDKDSESGGKSGEFVLLSVKDNGTGIPPEIRDKIFEPLYTTKAPGKGTGLGLSTVAEIVKNHGGFITIESEPGMGTEFKIFFPVLSGLAIVSEREVKQLPAGSGQTILVIDDELSVLNISQEILEAYGYKVITASDVQEIRKAYSSHEKERIALVMTDMHLPTTNGIEIISIVRTYDPDVKVIVCSGSLDEDGLVLPDNVKIQGFVAKPFTAEVLLTTIHNLLTV